MIRTINYTNSMKLNIINGTRKRKKQPPSRRLRVAKDFFILGIDFFGGITYIIYKVCIGGTFNGNGVLDSANVM